MYCQNTPHRRWVQGLVALIWVIGGLFLPVTANAQLKLLSSSTSSTGSSASNQFQLQSTVGEATSGPQMASTQFQQWPGFRLNTQDGTVQFNLATYTVEEGQSSITITVTRTNGMDRAASVKYATSDGTAIAGEDFTSTSGTLTWDAGDAQPKSFAVPISDDSIDETNESFTITLSNASAVELGSLTKTTVTITDNDSAGITVSAISGDTSESRQTATFTVVLDSEPTADVTLRVSSSDTTEGSVSPTTLTFTSTNWNQPQTVTVAGVDDSTIDGTQTYTVLLAATESADSFYNGIDLDDFTVANKDNDTAGVIVGNVTGVLKENSFLRASFKVRLKAEPASNVSLNLRITDANGQTDTTEASFLNGSELSTQTLTFTKDNWLLDQNVILYSRDDDQSDSDQTVRVIFENLVTQDGNYAAIAGILGTLTRSTTNLDDDSAGILIGTVVGNTSEDGNSQATVQVSLKTQPTATVTLAVASNNTAEVTASPATLTFSADNWSALQTVTFNGANDNEQDGTQTATVTFTGSGASEYVNATASVQVSNTDDDQAAFVISPINGNTREDGTSASFTVRLASQPSGDVILAIGSSNGNEGNADRSQLKFTDSNWNSDQTIQVFGEDDTERDGKKEYTITLDPSQSSDGAYQALSVQSVAVVNEDDEIVGILLSQMSNAVREDGTTGTFTVQLQLQPTAEVTINLVSSQTEEGIVSPNRLKFTTANWGAAQTVTVTGQRGTEGVRDGDQAFAIQPTIVSDDAEYAALTPTNVEALNLDIDTAGVVQSTISGQPTEDGGTAEFTLKLLSAPEGNVVINVDSSNESEGKVSPSILRFTPDNWSAPQKMVVQGQNEAQGSDTLDGPQRFLVNLTVDQSQTNDPAYSILTIESVEFFNQDNDSAAFVVSNITGNLQENGLIPQSFTVKLSSQPTNGTTVNVSMRTSDSSEGRLEPSQLIFTSADWSSEHKVNVFGVNDDEVDGDQSFYVHFDRAQSEDANYLLKPSSVSVVTEDDDQARFIVFDLEGLVREDGSTGSFKVRLGTLPVGEVVVMLTTEASDEVSLSKSTLTFTDKNWNADQTVSITGVADDVSDGNQAFAIKLAVDGTQTTDTHYAELTIEDITGINEDIDVAGLVFSETNANTSEAGDRSNFTLRLQSQPTGIVIINLAVTKPEEAELTTATVQFDETNWSANQTISVRGLNDHQQDKDQDYFVELTVDDSSADALYKNLPIERVPFVNEDNDVSAFLVTPLDQNTKEDGAKAEFKVRLSTIPDGDVTLSFQLEGSSTETPTVNDEVQLSTASLTFTPENWKADQRVVVLGLDDNDADGDQTFLITFNEAESTADANYQGLKPDLLQGINEDDDVADFVVETMKDPVSEEGTESSFQMRLRSRPEAGSTVTVSFQVVGEDTALPILSTHELAFNQEDWKSWKQVVVTGQNDELVDGTQPFKIVFFEVFSIDANYQGLVIPAIEGSTLDDDSANILISEVSGNTNEKGQRASFTIRLGSEPLSDVTLSANLVPELDSSDTPITDASLLEGKVVSGDETVVFTSDNWKAPQTIRVEGQDDDFEDGDQNFQVQFAVVSADPNYSGWLVAPVTILNEDDDNAGFIITELPQNIKEDGSSTEFQISLRSRPQDENQGGKNVTVQLTSSDTSEGTVSPSSIVFTSENWRSLHTVKVTGVDDAERDNDQTFRIDFSAAVSEDPRYQGLIPDSISIVNVDNEVPKFEVIPIAETVNEDGSQSQFQLRLSSQPTDEVSVEFSVSGEDTALPTLSQTNVTFTTANWNSWQPITITGQNDEIQDGDQPYQVVFNKSVSDDANYNELQVSTLESATEDNNISSVSISEPSGNTREDQQTAYLKLRLNSQPVGNVTITARLATEEDASGNPITDPALWEGAIVSGDETLVFTPINWNAEQRLRVVGQDDNFEDGDQPIQIRFEVTSTDPNYSGMSLDPVTVVNEDDDVAGIVVGELSNGVNEAGKTGEFFVRLRTNPGADVTLRLTTSNPDEVQFVLDNSTTSTELLRYNTNNWRGQQRVQVVGMDDAISDSHQLSTIRIEVDDNLSEAYQEVIGEEVDVINEDNDVAGIFVSTIVGTTKEDGSTTSFTVRLESEPQAEVNLDLSSSTPTEGAVLPTTLTFTPDNWDALQTVRVIGADDVLDDGDQSYSIEFAASISDDSNYQGLKPASLTVINEDDETPGFLLTEPSNNTREDGTQAEFCVRLSSAPAAGTSVMISTSSSLETEGIAFPPSLTFTDLNWQSCQIVTVIGQNDNEIPEARPPMGFFERLSNTVHNWFNSDTERAATVTSQDGDQPYQIILSAAVSDDPNYDGTTPSRVQLVNEDDDTAGYIFGRVEGTINENGSQGTFTIKLRTVPSGDVTLGLTVSDETEGRVSPAQLVFTPENFNGARTITVTGKDDLIADGDRSFDVRFLVLSTSNANNEYVGLETQGVTVTNTDNETPGLLISDLDGQPREDGQTGTFTVSLLSQPLADVTVGLSSSNTDEILFLSGATSSSTTTLNFDATNWDTPQTVTLQGVDEMGAPMADGNQLVRINISTAASADAAYSALYIPFVEVINEDDDSPGFIVTKPEGTLTEGIEGVATFTIRLKTAPDASVTIPLSLDRSNEIQLSETSLVFNTNNYDQPQTVTITSQDESIADKDQTVTILAGPTESSDSQYQGYLAGTLTVVNQDNDSPGVTVGSVQGNTTEDGNGSATFSLALQSEPTAAVTFTLSSLDTSEGTVENTTVTFNATNWNVPQIVTVNGVDDFVSDGNQIFQVTALLSSNDGNYDEFPFDPVSVVNEDDDQASFSLSPTSITVNENASTATITLGLGISPQMDVTFQLATDPTEAILSESSLTFTTANWDTPQTVIVTGVDDEILDGTVVSHLQITVVSEDEAYASLTPPVLTIQTEDNDVAGLIVSKDTVSVDENGTTDSFTLQLSTMPTAEVTVNLSTDATEASLSPTSLTFTTTNWKLPQTIVVMGVDDEIIDGSVASSIEISVVTTDPHFTNVVPPIITIQTADNDVGSFVLSDASNLEVTEANSGTDAFTVKLATQPSANVTLQFSVADTGEATVTESRTFTPTNWDTPQTVMITAVDDVVDDGAQTLTISTIIVSTDTAYSSLTFPAISFVTVDDDKQVDASDGGAITNSDTFTSSNLDLAINWDNGVNVGTQITSGGDVIREYIPAEGASSGISKTTTIMHKALTNGRPPGLEGLVEPQLVEGQKSTVYLEGNASGFVSDAASFVGTKTMEAATVQASINFDGGIEIAVTSTDSSQTILLPEMALGANAVISETGIEVEMALPDNVDGAPRLVGAIDSARWYYMGRDLETNEVVYLRGLEDGKIKIIRQLSENTTLIQVEAGSVEIRVGQAAPVGKLAGEEIRVSNQAYEFPIKAGSNLISAGVGSLLSPAELEVKMRHVHSVWRWNYVAPDWQVYSPQTTINQKLTKALKVSPMTTDIQLYEGLWIYAEEASIFWMHDKDYAELIPDLSLGGWYLLGNNTGQPIHIGEFFEKNARIQSLWLVRDDRWKAYATNVQIDAAIVEEQDVDQLSSEDILPPGHAFWVTTEAGITITRDKLRLPPGGQP